MSDLFRMIRVWISRNPYQFLLGLVGFVAAILIATFGLMKFLGILAITVLFYIVGLYLDKGIDLRDLLRRFTTNRHR